MKFHLSVVGPAFLSIATAGCGDKDPVELTGPCIAENSWTRDTANPVVSGTAITPNICDPAVIHDGGVFKMWMGCLEESTGLAHVCYSESVDGSTWTDPVNAANETGIVFSPNAPDAWDDTNVEIPTVMNDGGVYKMWYGGTGTLSLWQGLQSTWMGYATSPDGSVWTRLPAGSSPLPAPENLEGAVLSPGVENGDAGVVSDPSVVKKDGVYYAWYNAFGEDEGLHISLATSPDGITWTREASNPVLSADAPWEDDGPTGQGILRDVSHPTVLWDGSVFQMWYGSFEAAPTETYTGLGYAESADGINWTKGANPLFLPDTDAPGEEIGISSGPSVVEVGGVQHLFYCAANESGVRVINHATCGE